MLLSKLRVDYHPGRDDYFDPHLLDSTFLRNVLLRIAVKDVGRSL